MTEMVIPDFFYIELCMTSKGVGLILALLKIICSVIPDYYSFF